MKDLTEQSARRFACALCIRMSGHVGIADRYPEFRCLFWVKDVPWVIKLVNTPIHTARGQILDHFISHL